MFPISAMSGHVRRPTRLLALCCTLAASSLAPPSLPQEEPIDSPIIEREEVQFISLDLIVHKKTRKGWMPMRDLTPQDLLVKVGMAEVELDSFEDWCPESTPDDAVVARSVEVDGKTTYETEPLTYVLYFDLLHLKLEGYNQSFDAAARWAESNVLPDDRVMIVTGGYGLRIVRPLLPASQGLMDDLLAARSHWNAADSWAELEGDGGGWRGRIGEILSLVGGGMPSVAPDDAALGSARALANSYAAMDYSNTRRALENLEALMAFFETMDGTKNLILFQQTVRFYPGSQYPYADQQFISDTDLFLRRLARAANRRNVRFYPVAAGGLNTVSTNPAGRNTTTVRGRPDLPSDAAQQGLADNAMTMLASETGGRVVERTNELDVAFHKVVEDSSCFYRIGFRISSRQTGNAHRIAIIVGDGRGYRVRYRQTVDDPTDSQVEIDLVRGALLHPESADAFVVSAAAAPLFHYQGGSRVRLQITVPVGALLALRSGKGERSAHIQIGGVILPRLADDKRGGHGVMSGVDVSRQPWNFASGAVLKLTQGDSTEGRQVVMVEEIDAPPGSYMMIAVVEDELAREMGSAVVTFEVPEEPSALGPVLLAERDPDALQVQRTGKEPEESSSPPKGRKIRRARLTLPAHLLLLPDAAMDAGDDGEILYGVCDTPADEEDPFSAEDPELQRSLRCGGFELAGRLSERRIYVPGREEECFVVLETLPADAMGPGDCRYQVTLEPPGETRSLPFRIRSAPTPDRTVPASLEP